MDAPRPVRWACRIMWLASVAACHSTDPNSGNAISLSVAVLVDSATFRSQGEFVLDLVPSDRRGQTYITSDWNITARLTMPASVVITQSASRITPPDAVPVAAAILIDDSGSMRSNDPNRQRAAAAPLFWGEILRSRPGNSVALLDFGRGDAVPSPGFALTRLVAGFTSDPQGLDAVLDAIQAVPGGGTPLYQTGTEVLSWIDSTAPQPSRRTLVVITDGEPSDPAFADSLFSVATAHRIPIFAVGLGPAADDDPASPATALVKALATRTGGIYAAAETPDQLQPILQTLAGSANPARLQLQVKLSPVPPRGASVTGSVAISSFRGAAASDWSFVAQ